MNYLNNIFKQSIQAISGGSISSSVSTSSTNTLSNDSTSKADDYFSNSNNSNNNNSSHTNMIDPATHLFQLYKEVCVIIDSEANSFTSKLIDTESKLNNSKLKQNLINIYILLQTENKKLFKFNTSNTSSITSTSSSHSSTHSINHSSTATTTDSNFDNSEKGIIYSNGSSGSSSDSNLINNNDIEDDIPCTPCLDMFLNLKVVQHLCSRAVTDAPRGR